MSCALKRLAFQNEIVWSVNNTFLHILICFFIYSSVKVNKTLIKPLGGVYTWSPDDITSQQDHLDEREPSSTYE